MACLPPLKRVHDFGDGGAFPEIHYAQYPLDMGRKGRNKDWAMTLPVTVGEYGEVRYDAIVRQGENAKKIVYCQHKDLVAKVVKDEDHDEDLDVEEKQKIIEETARETKAALEKMINVAAAQPTKVPAQSQDPKFIKYKPSQQSSAYNSGAMERIIRMVEMPVDPIEPPMFKHKKVPGASGSPPVPLMHSPPRPVTVKDQQDWKIPPCISNWKNPKGYAIPLDRRLGPDGRGLQEVHVNDNMAKLLEALYVAEEKAREAVAMRSKVKKELMMKEKEKKEMELLQLARKARSERIAAGPMRSVNYECGLLREKIHEREKIREERRRQRRLEAAKDAASVGGKKRKITSDRDRDISEKVALGMACTSRGDVMMYDQRLFNQEKGMDSGFASTDDAYNIYDKGLFTAQPTLSTLYRPKKDVDSDIYGGADEQQLKKISNTDRLKPDKTFVGTCERVDARDRHAEFEDADPFGLDQLWPAV
ncbi:PREDICTED: SNW/SKI-interacting protein-like [Nicotiana attenuata]|uniref:Snwski-interacting protein n=1 Tax=Nicotiana attenuata TaxID=49451 RepID=A0A1J6I1I8_NICAT|nr:PREDICTED: SNW/SKI-interacting protein-like [Nicotiana attenuata]OIS98925.1 snwski-interacting protein [Nicotiana attenuata]